MGEETRNDNSQRQSLDGYLESLAGGQKQEVPIILVAESLVLADEEPGKSKEQWWSFQKFKEVFRNTREKKEKPAKPKIIREEQEEGYDRLDEEQAKKRPWWKGPIGCVAGLAVISCCVVGTTAILIPTMQRLLGISFGVDMESFKQASDVNKQGEKITEDLVEKAQEAGENFGENFEMKDAKNQGANFMERNYQDASRLFSPDTSVKADPFLTSILMQPPLSFEPGSKLTDYNRIFNQENWSIAQKLYMESLLIAAKEHGDPSNGGFERWLIDNDKDSVYTLQVNGQKVEISGAHLLQLIYNEYQSGDSLPMSEADQRLFKQYIQASERKWLTPEGKIEQRPKMSREDFLAIFEMASNKGMDAEQILSNGLTLEAELQASSAQAEIKALDLAQAGMGVSALGSWEGAILGFMMVIGFARPKFANILNFEEIKLKGQELLNRLKTSPEIVEEIRAKDNSRRMVNRLRHGLSLSREVIMGDLGAVLLDSNNQDIRDLISTEGPNWFRHLPEDHPEIRYIMSFFGCRNYQQLQDLAKEPEAIAPRLEKILTVKVKTYAEMGRGKDRGEKLKKVRQVLTDQQRQLIDLYRLTGE